MTAIELLRQLAADGSCQRAINGRYSVWRGSDFLGYVKEKTVAELVEKGFIDGRHIKGGTLGELEFSITRKGIAHVDKVSQLRMRYARSA